MTASECLTESRRMANSDSDWSRVSSRCAQLKQGPRRADVPPCSESFSRCRRLQAVSSQRVPLNTMITVMIVDDHPVVREGLNAMISAHRDITVVGEAETGSDAITLWSQLRPSVMVLDLLLPDMSGSEVIRHICDRSSNCQIVVLTSVAGDEEIYRALESGARGFLFKDTAREMLVDAIRAVSAGKRFVPAHVGARMAENLPRPGLTTREVEILGLVAAGLKNKEIAVRLKLSEATVNSHIQHVLEKLNASDRTHAVTVALRRGIIRL